MFLCFTKWSSVKKLGFILETSFFLNEANFMSVPNLLGLTLRHCELEIRIDIMALLVFHKQVLPPEVLTCVTVRKYVAGMWHNNNCTVFAKNLLNGAAQIKNCKQLLEYQHLLLLRDICAQSFNMYLNVLHFFNSSVN